MTSWDDQPTILTVSGIFFPFLDPKPEHINIWDIAHGLSMACRFAGQIRAFYSVAEHSVRVSQICDPSVARWALLHDASEAYLPDMPRPMKRCLPDFRAMERRIQKAICERFDLPIEEPAEVKCADLVMLATEGRDLCAPGWEWQDLPNRPLLAKIEHPFGPLAARDAFLTRYHELFS